MKKRILLFIMVMMSMLLTSCQGNKTPEILADDFNLYDIIETKKDNITLEIYICDSSIVRRMPASDPERFKNGVDHKVFIDYDSLIEYNDLLKQIDNSVITPINNYNGYLDIYTYYEFKSKRNGKILDVAFWGMGGQSNVLYINGKPAEYHPILLDIIIPFLTEEMRRELIAPDGYWDYYKISPHVY